MTRIETKLEETRAALETLKLQARGMALVRRLMEHDGFAGFIAMLKGLVEFHQKRLLRTRTEPYEQGYSHGILAIGEFAIRPFSEADAREWETKVLRCTEEVRKLESQLGLMPDEAIPQETTWTSPTS